MTMNTSSDQKHPCLTHHSVVSTICKRLTSLGISFFGYTALDKAGNAYCLGSKYDYAHAYLQRNHVRSDVHYRPTFKTKRFHYHFWDFVDLDTDARSLYQMAAEFDQGHTLTVIRFDEDITHCFHFSGPLADAGLNQRYLDKMDVLHSFIDYFTECLQSVPEIADIYKHPTNVQKRNVLNDKEFKIVTSDPRIIQLSEVANTELRFKHESQYYLTSKERECLSWLHKGKSAEMTAHILGVSRKTIERHIAAIKHKYDSYTMYQLGEKICAAGVSDYL